MTWHKKLPGERHYFVGPTDRKQQCQLYIPVLLHALMGFAVRVRSAGQIYGPTCHQRDRSDVTEFVTLVRLSSLGQHVGVLALAGCKRRKSALTASPILASFAVHGVLWVHNVQEMKGKKLKEKPSWQDACKTVESINNSLVSACPHMSPDIFGKKSIQKLTKYTTGRLWPYGANVNYNRMVLRSLT